jgi:integrase
MNASANLELDKRYQKKDGTYPVKLLIVVNGEPLRISTGYNVEEKYWQEKSQTIKTACKTFQNVTRVNNLLSKQKSQALDILMQLQDSKELEKLSLKDIKSRIAGNNNTIYTYQFCQQIITELEDAGKVGNARVYRMLLLTLQSFVGPSDFPLKQITYTWLKKYEAWYLARTNQNGKLNTLNGLNVNMRTLRALFNSAIKRDLVPQDSYPFKKYILKREATRKRAISQQGIAKLKQVEPQTERQRRAKDYFLMSFYLMGASFIDLAFLKVGDIKNGRVEYKRKKTGRLHSIKISPALQEIIDIYNKDKSANDFLLNIVSLSAPLKNQYAAVRHEMQRYNKSLKELSILAGIEEAITGYTARHTFATMAKFKGVPVAAISEALGHADIKTTQVYLDQFDTDTLDAYHEFIIGDD